MRLISWQRWHNRIKKNGEENNASSQGRTRTYDCNSSHVVLYFLLTSLYAVWSEGTQKCFPQNQVN